MNFIAGFVPLRQQALTREDFRSRVERSGDSNGWVGTHFSGPQVLVSNDGGVVAGSATNEHASLVFLGALYSPLPNAGSSPAPTCRPSESAEFLLKGYLERGTSFLDSVHGQYAVAVVDHRDSSLHLAADATRSRNLYYAEFEGSFVFSSRIATLAQLHRDGPSIDRQSEDFLLSYGFIPFGNTFFAGVREIEPGILLSVSSRERSKTTITPPAPWRDSFGSFDFEAADEYAAIDTLYEAFMAATEETASSSKQAGVLLGGVDSAAVAAALKRLGKEVRTFSFHYERSELNQTHTDTLATYLNIEHRWVPITSDDIREGLSDFPNRCNRPTNWPNYIIQTATVCRLMREVGLDAAYSGDGCDGIFLGYPRTHTVAQLLSSRVYIPSPMIRAIEILLSPRLFEYAGGRAFRVGMNLIRNFGRRHPARGFIPFRIMDDISLRHLRSGSPPQQRMGIEQTLEALTSGLEDLSPDRLSYKGKGMVGLNKAKISGAGDSSGIPILSPYLHSGMGALARGLPERLCRPKDNDRYKHTGKYLLLRMLEEKKLLPESVIFQRKISAVEGPIDEWYFGPLAPTLSSLLRHLPFDANEKFLANLLTEKPSDRLYVKYVSSDHLSTHELSMLATYASFAQLAQTVS